MKKYRRISIILLSISAIIGSVRGYRLTLHPDGNDILFPFPKDLINTSVFANYTVLGWVIFYLIGIFSLVAMACVLMKKRNHGYFIMAEGIFITFFSLTHIVFTEFQLIHLPILLIGASDIILGILQTPKEF